MATHLFLFQRAVQHDTKFGIWEDIAPSKKARTAKAWARELAELDAQGCYRVCEQKGRGVVNVVRFWIGDGELFEVDDV